MNTLNEEKKVLRNAMRSLPVPYERTKEGKAAAEYLSAWSVFQKADIVGCYVGIGNEIDTRLVLNTIISAGKALALPKTYEKGIMEFRRVLDPAFLLPGRWSIPEPGKDAQLIQPQEISLMLIPALAVDKFGRRLGQGAGYYDRYLPGTNCPLAALVLERQVVPSVPCGDRDYLVQWIITGNGILPALLAARA